jgi:catechol 2,3-dioxygenase
VAGGTVMPQHEADAFFQSVEFSAVTLRVSNLASAQAFYQDVLGFERRPSPPGEAHLGTPGGQTTLVVLRAAPDAPPRPRGTAGLFHVAFLYPNRAALARALRRLVDLGIRIGSADHGVSEALYLADPEGNGIELYVDRPPDRWPARLPDGQVAMYTEALDLPALLSEASSPGPLLPDATRIGHIHLSVADLQHAKQFYGERLGFAVTQHSYPGALFLGRDGYHHHIGANTWHSRDRAEDGVVGLAGFTVTLSGAGVTEESLRDLDGIPVHIVRRARD